MKKLAPSVRLALKAQKAPTSIAEDMTGGPSAGPMKAKVPLDAQATRKAQGQGDRAGIKVSEDCSERKTSLTYHASALIIHPKPSFASLDTPYELSYLQDMDRIPYRPSYAFLFLRICSPFPRDIRLHARARSRQPILRFTSTSRRYHPSERSSQDRRIRDVLPPMVIPPNIVQLRPTVP